MQKLKIPYISVTSHHMKLNNGSTPRFSGAGNALVALFLYFKAKVTLWVLWFKWANPTKIGYIHLFYADLTFLWPCDDLVTTLGLHPCKAQPQPMSPCVLHHMYSKCWPYVRKWQSLSYLVYFCHMRKGWHKGDYSSSPYINPNTYWCVLLYLHAGV